MYTYHFDENKNVNSSSYNVKWRSQRWRMVCKVSIICIKKLAEWEENTWASVWIWIKSLVIIKK